MDKKLQEQMQAANKNVANMQGQIRAMENKDLKQKIEQLNLKIKKLEEELACRSVTNGRPLKVSLQQRQKIRELRKNGATLTTLASSFNCSRTTIIKICKGIKVDCRYKTVNK